MSTRALFDFCARAKDADALQIGPGPIRVTGFVVKVALGHDGTPLVWLEAEPRGNCRVECRCLSDNVLLRARAGSEATVEGFCVGLEDSLTVVMDRCELVSVEGRPVLPGVATRKTAGDEEGASEALRCTFCGRPRDEVQRLMTLGGKSICDRCVGEYSQRLRSEAAGSQASAGPAKPAPRTAASKLPGRVGRFLRRLRERLLSLSPASSR